MATTDNPVIAVIFSDLHINDWAKFNKDDRRTKDHFRVLRIVKRACNKYNCISLFCGDLFHKPENISLHLYSRVVDYFEGLDDSFKVYGISGNHDIVEVSKMPIKPESWLSSVNMAYRWVNCIDYGKYTDKVNHVQYHGVPYIDHNIGLNEYIKNLELDTGYRHVLLLHTDYPGAKDTDGTEVGTSENLNTNLLDRFDLTLIGHIHKPQRLSKKVYMVGAPLQQRRTDKNCDLGIWYLHKDLSMEFVSLSNKFPKFVDVSSEEEIKDDGNYYTVVANRGDVILDQVDRINKKLSKRGVVRRYLKEVGVTDKKKKSILLNIIKESEND